jgi:hypothetical protein
LYSTHLGRQLLLLVQFFQAEIPLPATPPHKHTRQGFCKGLVRWLHERVCAPPSPAAAGAPAPPPDGVPPELLAAVPQLRMVLPPPPPQAPVPAAVPFGEPGKQEGGVAGDAVAAAAAPVADPAKEAGGDGGGGAAGGGGVAEACDVLRALGLLLEAQPRLMGLLASRSALAPLVACLAPAAALTGLGRGCPVLCLGAGGGVQRPASGRPAGVALSSARGAGGCVVGRPPLALAVQCPAWVRCARGGAHRPGAGAQQGWA